MTTTDRVAPLLGCIADDLTGAADVGGALTRDGLRVVQVLGVPREDLDVGPADALVVALKTRSAPVAQAVQESLQSLRWLRAQGCQRIAFKYCSTFDSTDDGNIGPVADALLDALDHDFAVVAPSFPRNGRTVYKGHLFVGATLLSESGMQHHPLTPMTDANLVRVLGRQTTGRVGLVDYPTVEAGPAAVRDALDVLRADGFRYAVVDALSDEHLLTLAAATVHDPLVTGGSAIAWAACHIAERTTPTSPSTAAPAIDDRGVECPRGLVIAGSCSTATLRQIAHMRDLHPSLRLDLGALAAGHDAVAQAVAWATPLLTDGPVLIYSSGTPTEQDEARRLLGPDSSVRIEAALGEIARRLVHQGVRHVVVAGGETSGAVMAALGVSALVIGAEIEPGVPVAVSTTEPHVAVALKSGNFGSPEFFDHALRKLAAVTNRPGG
jgi:uncharacterized protein YgbK (DUF1537 family)